MTWINLAFVLGQLIFLFYCSMLVTNSMALECFVNCLFREMNLHQKKNYLAR